MKDEIESVETELSGLPKDEVVFVNMMARLIDEHKLETPEFIKRHIRAFDAYGMSDMADFWRDALAAYDQAFAMAVADLETGSERQLKIVH